jgi:hypothetical protein
LAEASALVALAVGVISAVLLVMHGPADSCLVGLSGVGISIRLDAVSVVMLLLVSFIGWVVVRYAATYLDGEARQGAFTGWLCMTLASVLLLVLAGSYPQGRRRRAGLPPGAGDLCGCRVWFRLPAQVASGHCARRHPDLRRRLFAGTGVG